MIRYYQKANSIIQEYETVTEASNSLLSNYENAMKEKDAQRIISEVGKPPIRASDVRGTCDRVLKGMKRSLERLNVDFDDFIYESAVVEDGSLWKVIEGLKESPLCKEDDGAFYLDLSEHIKGGDDDRFKRRFVFTRSDGSALYTTRDLAYHKWKLDNSDHAINILGEDHRYQSQMLSLSLKELGSKNLPEAVFYAFVSLPEGKMSTRRARVVFLDDLLDEAVERAREEVLKRREDLSEDELNSISEMVGIGALRFNMIKVQPEKKIVFRWEDALNFEGSSAPFIQYSHARACSILRKVEGDMPSAPAWSKIVEDSEKDLLIKLAEFGDIVLSSARDRKVHLLSVYLVDLASRFNEFYRDCPVLNEIDRDRKDARVALVDISREVLSTGLSVLGIHAPDSM
jgi:arginyl-tRNA synthetase